MSKIPDNSYPVPRDLEKDDYFKTAKPLWKLVMYWLMSHAVYKDELAYDLNGSIVILKRGQVAFTLRQIADDLDIHKNDVERAILHFTGYNTKRELSGLSAAGRRTILVRQELGQKARQEKSVYNIVWEGYYETGETRNETRNETGGETRKRQERDINKKDKKEQEGFKEGDNSLRSLSPPPPPIKEVGGGGGGKKAFIYEGMISKLAYNASRASHKAGIPVRPDKFQSWIDDYGLEAVKLQFDATIEEVKGGKKIGSPAMYLGKRISNNHLTLKHQEEGRQHDNRSVSA